MVLATGREDDTGLRARPPSLTLPGWRKVCWLYSGGRCDSEPHQRRVGIASTIFSPMNLWANDGDSKA